MSVVIAHEDVWGANFEDGEKAILPFSNFLMHAFAGDAGEAAFLIRRDDLLARALSRDMSCWDCQ